mgnify:CR=1 FL=1|tara:strand:+ start:7101 stop:7436 length:336 start_codon:yes stop_codon:yes gene_type:complete
MVIKDHTFLALAVLATASFVIPFGVYAETPDDTATEATAEQIAQIKVDITEAIKIARAQNPGTVIGVKLEYEDGHLVYDVEYRSNGEEEVEVIVNAVTGAVINEEHDEEDD